MPLSELGQALAGARLDAQNLLSRTFLEAPRHTLALVDTALTSNAFSVTVGTRADARFDLRLPSPEARAKLGAKVELALLDERTIRFAGHPALTFAFTCVGVDLGPDGQLRRLQMGERVTFRGEGSAAHLPLWPQNVAGDIDEHGG